MNKKAGRYPIQRGHPDMAHVTTNHVERVNLTLRTHLRRHTRRTSGHSKKLDRHQAAIALLIAHYNFCRVHEGLCVTPAMEYGLTYLGHCRSRSNTPRTRTAAPTTSLMPFKLYVERESAVERASV